MRQICAVLTIIVTTFFSRANAQVVLNELYASPGSNTHEFFELFNTSTDPTPASVDGFTILSYVEDGSTSGFYALDLPALTISPRGYFVGSAALPFNYQGVTNSTRSNFSWNDPALTTNGGFLQKWMMTGNDASDGNKDYNLATVSPNLNDLFYSRSSGGFNYAVFIFQNGVLINNFYGGTGGSTTQPAVITSMPKINLTYNSGGVSHPFTFDPSKLTNSQAEYVINDAGTDNGFIRSKDGVCGTWTKSSSQVNHTPSMTNGFSSGSGTLTISGTIVRGVSPATTSLLTYDVTAGASTSFPVTLYVYLDNGSVPGQLDATDTYLTSTVQTALSDPAATLNFSPRTANILVVAETDAGCFGQVKYIGDPLNQTLPVKLVSFSSSVDNNSVNLTWRVDENETAKLFEMQRSNDGSAFSTISAINAFSTSGTANYRYSDATDLKQTTYYRLRMTDVNSKVEYSKILAVRAAGDDMLGFSLVQNPVTDKLYIQIASDGTSVVTVKVMDISGAPWITKGVQVNKGTNLVILELPSAMSRGLFVAAISDKKNRMSVKKFLRN
jgi:hypothetical protein